MNNSEYYVNTTLIYYEHYVNRYEYYYEYVHDDCIRYVHDSIIVWYCMILYDIVWYYSWS